MVALVLISLLIIIKINEAKLWMEHRRRKSTHTAKEDSNLKKNKRVMGRVEGKGVDLDHGLAQDLNERLSLKARGSESGGYDAHDPAPKLAESGHVSACAHRRSNRHSGHNAMDYPRLRGVRGTKQRRRRRRWRWRWWWGTNCHDPNKRNKRRMNEIMNSVTNCGEFWAIHFSLQIYDLSCLGLKNFVHVFFLFWPLNPFFTFCNFTAIF